MNKNIYAKLVAIFIITIIFFRGNLAARSDSINVNNVYKFIIRDSPAQLFTMRQVNQNYLSAYRLFSKELQIISQNENITSLIEIAAIAFFFVPMTHEEGHRSILTGKEVGSISQPYFNLKGAAYVKGITDKALQNLRDNDLPNYIRLHTGGLESDYMLTKRAETIGSFNKDDFKHYKYEYFLRKVTIMQYYLTGLLKYDIDIKEEKNELERDIVGHDVYGAVRHLHRPAMEFYRYTKYGELTKSEKRFVKRLGYRSFMNLLNPLILGINNFRLTEKIKINIGMGFTMAPFGDFIDENIWLKIGNNINISIYARQFQNKKNWFNGFGISLTDFKITERILTNISGHYWNQPKDFNFWTSESFNGGAIDVDLSYFFFVKKDLWLKGFSLDLGLIYKTEGFLPEQLYLEEHFGIRIGTSFIL